MRIVNFAHGDFLMLGSYSAYWFVMAYHLDFFLSIFISIPLFALVGLFVYEVLARGLLKYPEVIRENMSVILFFGLSITLVNFARIIWSSTYRYMIPLFQSLALSNIYIPLGRVVATTGALIATMVLYLFLTRTYTGNAIQAVAQDKEVSMLVGINPSSINRIAFVIGIIFASLGGALISLYYTIFPDMGLPFSIASFVIIILGGLGSFLGVLFGGIIVAVSQVLVAYFIGSEWAGGVMFFLLVLATTLRFRFIERM